MKEDRKDKGQNQYTPSFFHIVSVKLLLQIRVKYDFDCNLSIKARLKILTIVRFTGSLFLCIFIYTDIQKTGILYIHMDLFVNSIIQENIQSFFTQSLLNNRLSHAYIFHGERGSGKEAFAIRLAQVLNCENPDSKPCGECPSCIKISKLNHPDIKFLYPVSKQIKTEEFPRLLRQKAANPYADISVPGFRAITIEAIRDLKSEAKYAPFEARKRVFIISGAEYFTREASNSFLKLLEEPPENLMLILITNDLHSLLDTIRSRCQPVYFPRFNDQQIKAIIEHYHTTDAELTPVIRTAQNDIKRVFQLLEEDLGSRRERVYTFLRSVAGSNYLNIFGIIDELSKSKNKQEVDEFLELLILWLRDAVHVNFLEDDAEYVNLEYAEAIHKFAGLFRNADYDALILAIERTRFSIAHNAHTALALSALAVEIKHLLMEQKQAMEAKAS